MGSLTIPSFCESRKVISWAALSLFLFVQALADTTDWSTNVHKPGYCALYGICGHRKDNDVLSCPVNVVGQQLNKTALTKLQAVCPQLVATGGEQGAYCCDEEQIDQMIKQFQLVGVFLVGCPACDHNFKHFFCLLTCSPDQATFANVTDVQIAEDTNKTSVKQVDYFVSGSYGTRLYDSCKDVTFSASNVKAMQYVGGGAKNYQQLFDFVGTVKDKRVPPIGSPFQLNFPDGKTTPMEMQALDDNVPPCWDSAFRCGCGDCPDSPQCEPPPPVPPPPPSGCTVLGLPANGPSCLDVSLLLSYILFLAALLFVWRRLKRRDYIRTTSTVKDMEETLLGQSRDSASRTASADGQGWMEIEPQDESVDDYDAIKYPKAEQYLRWWFFHQGRWCATHTFLCLSCCFVLLALCCLGLIWFKIETEPQRLWVGNGSQAAQDKARYEASFGAFYRIEQLILSTNPNSSATFISPSGLPAIVTDDNIQLLFKMQQKIDAINVTVSRPDGFSQTASLTDVCFKPFGDVCATQSVLQYWKMDPQQYSTMGKTGPHTPDYCFTHWSTECRSTFEAPMDPHIVLGGFPRNVSNLRNYTADATAFVVTYPVDSSPRIRDAALAWEAAYIQLAQTELRSLAESANLTLSFSTERSVQDELQKESNADAPTIAISYVVMLTYIAVAMATFPVTLHPLGILVYTRLSLGLGGVLIVVCAVVGALGVVSWLGLWSTLIIMEVIPFLVLALGVDNMFILAHALHRQSRSVPLPDRMGAACAEVGPSITLAATCEIVAFAIGGFTGMPAIRNFAVCAAVAVLLDYILQMSAFVSFLALDTGRLEDNRVDIAPCLKLSSQSVNDSVVRPTMRCIISLKLWGSQAPPIRGEDSAETDRASVDVPGQLDTSSSNLSTSSRMPSIATRHVISKEWGVSAVLHWYISQLHIPLLRRRDVQCGILALFFGGWLLAIATVPHLSRGLDQSVALPQDSYLQQYYSDVATVLRVGPPLMFVVQNLNMSSNAPDINKVCSTSGCNDNSMLSQIAGAARLPSQSYIATPAASWLDDYLAWINPTLYSCCRAFPNRTHCPPANQPPCSTDPKLCEDCSTCYVASGSGHHSLHDGRPDLQQVQESLPWFLESLPGVDCAKGGLGAYNNALQHDTSDPTGLAGLGDNGVVLASAFRSNNVALSNQNDFIGALQAARDMCDDIRSSLDLDVYPYSIFHIFFEQYLTIRSESVILLAGALAAIFIACLLLTESLWGSVLILLVIAMILTDMMGVMVLWSIQLNAVSLVNLVISCGIAVEFCAHILRAFLVTPGERGHRSEVALREMGASVLSGITLTKFIGVVVLMFAKTQIFEVYYFRMYLSLVLLGAAHGLVLLPVLLTLIGPPPLGARDVSKMSHIPGDSQDKE